MLAAAAVHSKLIDEVSVPEEVKPYIREWLPPRLP